jgi:hypothetical protein
VVDSLKSLGLKVWFAPVTLEVGDRLLDSTLKSNNAGKRRIPFINLILINTIPKKE